VDEKYVKHCWASVLGDCAGKISEEHYISRSVLRDEMVQISGFQWCASKPLYLPVARLVSNILCEHHNGGSSNLDAEAANFINALTEASSGKRLTPAHKPAWWPVTFDGRLVERWLLKTLINIAHQQPRRIGLGGTTGGKPDPQLVGIVYGLSTFQEGAGLYAAPSIGPTAPEGELTFSLLHQEDDGAVIGCFAILRGLYFVLSLIPDLPGDVVQLMPGFEDATLLYRDFRITFNMAPNKQKVNLRW
jgi:hypothetical protein